MKLYDSIGPNPQIVRMFMAEKGIETPKQGVDLRGGENRQAEHLKRNPMGQMPTLELDGRLLSLRSSADLRISRGEASEPAVDRRERGRARRVPYVDPPRRSQHRRADDQRLPLRRRLEVFRETRRLRARGLARPEEDHEVIEVADFLRRVIDRHRRDTKHLIAAGAADRIDAAKATAVSDGEFWGIGTRT